MARWPWGLWSAINLLTSIHRNSTETQWLVTGWIGFCLFISNSIYAPQVWPWTELLPENRENKMETWSTDSPSKPFRIFQECQRECAVGEGSWHSLLFSCDWKNSVHTISECHEDIIYKVSRKSWWESKWGHFTLSGTAREIGVEEPEKEGLLSTWLAIWSLFSYFFPSVPKGKKVREIFPSESTAGIIWWSLVKHVGSGKQV